jgi:hypothetical protein
MSGTTDLRGSIDPEVIYYLNISPPLIPFISALQVIVQAPDARFHDQENDGCAVLKTNVRPRHHQEAV